MLLQPPKEDGKVRMGCWRPLTPAGKQRLEAPHYQQYFEVSKLHSPEAVTVLRQRMKPDSKGPGRPGCGEPFQAWEMWLSPDSEKPVGSEVGGQDPRPWISSPVGNQACIVPRLL